jgi:hypothetical protein
MLYWAGPALIELVIHAKNPNLFGNLDIETDMKVEIRQASIIHTKEGQVPLDEPMNFIYIHTGIHICTYCDSWWNDGDMPKHNLDCKRPVQSP